MMRVHLLLRRVHAYLGMFLLPWVVVYALSAFVLNHPDPGAESDGWTLLWERAAGPGLALGDGGSDLRRHGARLLRDAGLAPDAYGVFRRGDVVQVTLHDFRRPVRVTHHLGEERLVAEVRENGPAQTLVAMHLTAGYEQSSVASRLWAAGVDLVAVAIQVWIATGLVLWWRTRSARRWGGVMLAVGFATFGVVVWRL